MIDYTYPERPTKAIVKGDRNYTLARDVENNIHLAPAHAYTADVPEVAEAMMTLAGHEWPKPSIDLATKKNIERTAKVLAERIIARLEEYEGHTSTYGPLMEIREAIRILREECGL